MCMIGEGAGVVGIAILTAFPSTTLDVVEKDSTVIEVARDYFGFYTSSNQKLVVYNSDGRDFLKDARGYYDVILLDAIQLNSKSSPSVPHTKSSFHCNRPSPFSSCAATIACAISRVSMSPCSSSFGGRRRGLGPRTNCMVLFFFAKATTFMTSCNFLPRVDSLLIV